MASWSLLSRWQKIISLVKKTRTIRVSHDSASTKIVKIMESIFALLCKRNEVHKNLPITCIVPYTVCPSKDSDGPWKKLVGHSIVVDVSYSFLSISLVRFNIYWSGYYLFLTWFSG